MSQGPFLKQLGLPLRLQGLLKAAKTDERREEIRSAAVRLVDPMGMGKEYQVMGITNQVSGGSESASVWPFPDPDPKEKSN
jgi:NADH dehydrogenase [ubiquinone] 1 alpha subcomplex assembly factor 7